MSILLVYRCGHGFHYLFLSSPCAHASGKIHISVWDASYIARTVKLRIVSGTNWWNNPHFHQICTQIEYDCQSINIKQYCFPWKLDDHISVSFTVKNKNKNDGEHTSFKKSNKLVSQGELHGICYTNKNYDSPIVIALAQTGWFIDWMVEAF